MKNDYSYYSVDDLNRAVQKYYNVATFGKLRDEKPKAYILGGQGGAGKSTIQKLINDKEPNTVIINGDKYREEHPNYEIISKVYGNEAANYTQSFANAVASTLVEKLSDEGYNVVIEGTCRRLDVPLKTCNDLKEKGYTVELSVMCTDKETAWQSTIDRYNKMVELGMTPRAVPRGKYDETVKVLPSNVSELYKLNVFDEITLFNRNQECIYRMTETPTTNPEFFVCEKLNFKLTEYFVTQKDITTTVMIEENNEVTEIKYDMPAGSYFKTFTQKNGKQDCVVDFHSPECLLSYYSYTIYDTELQEIKEASQMIAEKEYLKTAYKCRECHLNGKDFFEERNVAKENEYDDELDLTSENHCSR